MWRGDGKAGFCWKPGVGKRDGDCEPGIPFGLGDAHDAIQLFAVELGRKSWVGGAELDEGGGLSEVGGKGRAGEFDLMGNLGGREVGWVGIGEAVEAGLNDDGPKLIEALGDGIDALV